MSFIFELLLLCGLLVVAMVASTIRSGILSMNHYQLKRQAQLGNKSAKRVYPLLALRYEVYIVSAFIQTATSLWLVLFMREHVGALLAIVLSSLLLVAVVEVLSLLFLRSRVLDLLALSESVLRKIVGVASPVLRPVAKKIELLHATSQNAIYTKEQLVALFESTQKQSERDVTNDEIRMLQGVLNFSETLVRDTMTPRRMVKTVEAGAEVGPLLMDELYKTGHSRFPVVASSDETLFVGTLYLRDLVSHAQRKKLGDIMSKEVRYIHEEESLDRALRAFLKTKHHLFVVVNNFEEFVGVLSIEDVLEEILGKEIVDEFDRYDDLRAVAKQMAERDKQRRTAKTDTTEKSQKVVK